MMGDKGRGKWRGPEGPLKDGGGSGGRAPKESRSEVQGKRKVEGP